jgi:Fur family ferric uptake transcriptional regulator
MDKDNKIRETVKQRLTDYLAEKKFRRTPERYAILDIIYTEQRRLDVDMLHQLMVEKKMPVSRATIYNTLQLLSDCRLVVKHHIGYEVSFYERTYRADFHQYLVCLECGKITENKDSELKNIIRNRKIRRFSAEYYSVYAYGFCSICARRIKKKQSKENNNNPLNKRKKQ